MPMPAFQLHEPTTLDAASDLLGRHRGKARILAGGTDLLTDLRYGRVTGVEHLILLRGIDGLRSIEETPGGYRFGSLVTPNELARDVRVREKFPAIAEAAGQMAAYPIRNMATLGGNIAGAVPCSDLAPPFIVVGAEAVLRKGESGRRIRLQDFFLGPRRTVCSPDEILTHLTVPHPSPRSGTSYQRFSLRGANAVAVASVAAMLQLSPGGAITDCRVALGAVAPIPDVATRTCAFLLGKEPAVAVLAEAAKIARSEARPQSDVRGSKEYRHELVEVLARRALAQAAQRAGGTA